MKKWFSRANITLFAITTVATLIAAFVCHLCHAENATTVAVASMAGVASLLGIGAIFEMANLKMPMRPEAGVVGVLTGTAITLILI